MGYTKLVPLLHATSALKSCSILEALRVCAFLLYNKNAEQNRTPSCHEQNLKESPLIILIDSGMFSGPDLHKVFTYDYNSGRALAANSLFRVVRLLEQLFTELEEEHSTQKVTVEIHVDGGNFKHLVKSGRGKGNTQEFYRGVADGWIAGLNAAKWLHRDSITVSVYKSPGEAEGAVAHFLSVYASKNFLVSIISGDSDATMLCGYVS